MEAKKPRRTSSHRAWSFTRNLQLCPFCGDPRSGEPVRPFLIASFTYYSGLLIIEKETALDFNSSLQSFLESSLRPTHPPATRPAHGRVLVYVVDITRGCHAAVIEGEDTGAPEGEPDRTRPLIFRRSGGGGGGVGHVEPRSQRCVEAVTGGWRGRVGSFGHGGSSPPSYKNPNPTLLPFLPFPLPIF